MDSSTSSIVSALGGGSGVDMAKLATDLSQARFAAQVQQLEARSELMETRISSASALKSQISQLATALGDRIRSGDLAPTASTTQPGIATVSVAGGSSARGTYSLEVTQLAASQTLVGKAYANTDALVGEGTLTLRFGSVQGASFTSDTARPAVDIAVSADDTLATLASKISASGSGITAYVAVGADGAQLVMKGPDGAASGFTVTGTGSSAAGAAGAPGNIDYLDWSPAADAGQLKQTARDATFRFDGVDMTSASNQVSGLPSGMSLALTGTNAGSPTQISFAPQGKQTSALMSDLVSALNEIASTLNKSADPMGGELGNDSGARSLKRALSSLTSTIVMPSAAAGEPRTLGDLGLALTRDGTFALDETRLNTVLTQQPAAVQAMFTTGLYGVYGSLDKFARTVGNTTDPGSLGGSITRYSKLQAEIGDRLSSIAEKQEALRAQLSRSFTWADRDISASQSTLSFLQSQVAAWNASKD